MRLTLWFLVFSSMLLVCGCGSSPSSLKVTPLENYSSCTTSYQNIDSSSHTGYIETVGRPEEVLRCQQEAGAGVATSQIYCPQGRLPARVFVVNYTEDEMCHGDLEPEDGQAIICGAVSWSCP